MAAFRKCHGKHMEALPEYDKVMADSIPYFGLMSYLFRLIFVHFYLI